MLQYLFCDVGNNVLFENIIQYRLYNKFWCYGFKRDVAKKISRNHKANKISYTSIYLQRYFTIIYINI